ncbi:MAG TPA: hypothetical protein VN796_09575 [Acidimicrobiales bacterium]|nr:hypothetical protein [Acidimicrobiales bacterium]
MTTRHSARGQMVGAVLVYLALSVVVWWHVWVTGDPASSITCGCGDTAQGVWWMEWVPWALRHGHNLFLSHQLFSRRGGVNALANTSALLLSLLLSPLTMIAGPVASFNVADLLAPVISGLAVFLAAGTVTRLFPARVMAGVLYAFSPFMLRNTVIGHLQLTWAFYPPLVFLLLVTLVRDRGVSPTRIGVELGVLTILQFFVGLETIALTGIAVAVAALVALVAAPRRGWRCAPPVARALATAAGVAAIVLAYPLWFFLAGPQHVAGPLFTGTGAPAGAIVNPGAHVHQGNALERVAGYLGAGGPGVEYLGVALLVFLALSAPVWRHRRLGLVLGGSALVLWLLSVRETGFWPLVERWPLLSSIVPVRFTMVIDMIAGLLLACSIDGWWALARRGAARTGRRRMVRRLAAGSLAAVVLAVVTPIAVTYTLPLAVGTPSVPSWFLSDAPGQVPGSTVLAVPFSDGPSSVAMFWQAKAGFSYSLIAGWEFVPGGDHRHEQLVSPIGGAFSILRSLSSPGAKSTPDLTSGAVHVLRRAMTRWLPLDVAVARDVPGATVAVGYLTVAIGTLPTFGAGVWSWRLRALGPTPVVSDAVFRRCLLRSEGSGPLAVPRCVLHR